MKTDEMKGKAEELGGTLVKVVGGVLGDPAMERRGAASELSGQVAQDRAKAAERTHGAIDEVLGKVEETAGAVVGDEEIQAQGRKKRASGAKRREANQARKGPAA